MEGNFWKCFLPGSARREMWVWCLKHSGLEHPERGSHARPREPRGPRRTSAPGGRAVHTRGVSEGRPGSPDATAAPGAARPDRKGLHRRDTSFTSAETWQIRPFSRRRRRPAEGGSCSLAEMPSSKLHTWSGHLHNSPWRAALTAWL